MPSNRGLLGVIVVTAVVALLSLGWLTEELGWRWGW